MQHVQDQYFEFPCDSSRGAARAASDGAWARGPWNANASAAISTRSSATSRGGDRRRDKQGRQGLDPRAVGRGVRRPLFGLWPAAGARRRTFAARGACGARDPRTCARETGLGAWPRGLQETPFRSSTAPRSVLLAGHRPAAHQGVALDRPVGCRLIGYRSNPKRVGPYRRFRDLLIDVYGDPGEETTSDLDGESHGSDAANQRARCARQGGALARALLV